MRGLNVSRLLKTPKTMPMPLATCAAVVRFDKLPES